MALSSGNFGKYKFITDENVSSEKDLLEKAATIKRSEYSPLGSELKKRTDIATKKKTLSILDKIYDCMVLSCHVYISEWIHTL